MAIQMRRGLYQDFDPTKMLAGEWAIVTGGDPNTASGRAIYHAFAAGQVERVATYVDAAQIIINSIPDTVDALTQAVEVAEATRALAEAARVQAEEARALAESGRASAETAREQKVITSATATADSGVGTPSVDVTLGQPSSLGRALAFAFHNIKGAKGDKGDKGDTVSVEPVTTSQIDTIAADGTVTSDLEALTATGLTYLWGKIKAAFAALTHSHAASDITSGTLAVARGGTNASDASGARTNLGVPSTTDVNNLEASLASVEQLTAVASHASGSHFILDGILRKATSAIATGESITSSNSTTDTVQAQIDALKPVAMTATAKTNMSITNSDCCVADGVVFVNITVKATNTVNAHTSQDGSGWAGYVDLATIPEHPAANIAGPMLLWAGSSYVPTNFAVRTNGTVQVYRPAGMTTNDIAYLSMFFKQ